MRLVTDNRNGETQYQVHPGNPRLGRFRFIYKLVGGKIVKGKVLKRR
jgi:hypothetical protein